MKELVKQLKNGVETGMCSGASAFYALVNYIEQTKDYNSEYVEELERELSLHRKKINKVVDLMNDGYYIKAEIILLRLLKDH